MLVLFENGVIENDYCRCMLMLEHQHTLKSFMYDVHITWYGSVLWEVGGQSSALIDPVAVAGAAHRSERRRPLVSPTSSRCSAREREECK